jgi:hypothetical protein
VDIEDENVCVDSEELVMGEFDIGEVETFEEIGVIGEGGGGGREISKISTTLEYPLLELFPPPKNILFVDDVDARK